MKALPKVAKAAEHEELRQAIEEHLEETKGHVQRLERVFEIFGEKAKGKKPSKSIPKPKIVHHKSEDLMAILKASDMAIERFGLRADEAFTCFLKLFLTFCLLSLLFLLYNNLLFF